MAPDGTHLVLTMEEHTAVAAELAQHFGGNDLFERPQPRELLIELVAEHDRGWAEIDRRAPRDPDTNLPWSVYDAPLAHSLAAGAGSIEHNERCHPYRGLVSSMHISGLYNGRFGLSEPPSLEHLSEDEQRQVAGFLETEESRRGRLRAGLAADPATAGWVARDRLMSSYKALQFFDRLALWLQVNHPTARPATIIPNVPGAGSDHDLVIDQVDGERAMINPYPFDIDPLRVNLTGRFLQPQPRQVDLADVLDRAPRTTQRVVLASSPRFGGPS
ncbi:MAG: DUF3891 family protein [Acidimicrobiia bacterium]|nr:DUF3891 family protein [Acidimicrobiia bacterium]